MGCMIRGVEYKGCKGRLTIEVEQHDGGAIVVDVDPGRIRCLAIGRRQLRDAELGLAPLEHLRHPVRARVVRAHVNNHL